MNNLYLQRMLRYTIGLFTSFILIIHVSNAEAEPQAHNAVIRGEQIFQTHCAGCHALRFTRGPLREVSMPPEDAAHWFGRMPPDLSLIARVRGHAWLLSYLHGFYSDAHRPFGSNNRAMPFSMMPNPFASLTEGDDKMSREELDQIIDDLIVYLDHVADPSKQQRIEMGIKILLFLFICWLVIYNLYRLYWREHVV